MQDDTCRPDQTKRASIKDVDWMGFDSEAGPLDFSVRGHRRIPSPHSIATMTREGKAGQAGPSGSVVSQR